MELYSLVRNILSGRHSGQHKKNTKASLSLHCCPLRVLLSLQTDLNSTALLLIELARAITSSKIYSKQATPQVHIFQNYALSGHTPSSKQREFRNHNI